jgi:hypothetical protein
LRRKNVKKLFLVLLALLVGMSGLSAAPPGEGGVDSTLWIGIPQVNIALWDVAPGIPAPIRPGGVLTATLNKTPVTQDLKLICLWLGQYQEGRLAANDFKTLAAGRITVMYVSGQTIEAMQLIASLAPVEYPLLC